MALYCKRIKGDCYGDECPEQQDWEGCVDRGPWPKLEATAPQPVSPSKLSDLLKAICDCEEMCLLSGHEEQRDAEEPRYRIEISGPERLLKPLADILHGV